VVMARYRGLKVEDVGAGRRAEGERQGREVDAGGWERRTREGQNVVEKENFGGRYFSSRSPIVRQKMKHIFVLSSQN